MFPFRALKRGGTFGLFATEAGKLEVIKLNPDRGRIFHCKFGYFQLNKKYRYQFGKSDVYFYDQKGFNPLDISALVNIKSYLQLKKMDTDNEMKNAPTLTEYEIALVTNKFQDYLISTQFVTKDENGVPVTLSADATALQNVLIGKLDDNTRTFLDDYFEEDEIAQTNMLARIQQEIRFRVKESRGAHELIPHRNTIGKRNIALVVINNRMLDLVPVEAMQDQESGLMIIKDMDSRYGTFMVKETKTRYRHGKTNIFIVGVKTQRKTKAPVPEIEQPNKPQEVLATTTGQEVVDPIKEIDPNKPLTTKELIDIMSQIEEARENKKKGRFGKKKDEDKKKEEEKKVKLENGKGKKEKKAKKVKIELDPLTGNPKEGDMAIEFIPIVRKDEKYSETISINATTFLPKVAYVDPLLAETRVKTTQHQKVVTDLLGGAIGKKIPINPILVLLLIMGTAIGSVIMWQQIVEPALEKAEARRIAELNRNPPDVGTPPVTGIPGDGEEIFNIPNLFG